MSVVKAFTRAFRPGDPSLLQPEPCASSCLHLCRISELCGPRPRNPILCRVFSYFFPGFPSPAITNINVRSFHICAASSGIKLVEEFSYRIVCKYSCHRLCEQRCNRKHLHLFYLLFFRNRQCVEDQLFYSRVFYPLYCRA